MESWGIYIVVACCLVIGTYGGPLEFPVYLQEHSIAQYLYKRDLPEMTQNTICFWANLGYDADGLKDDYLFSVSTSAYAHAFRIGFTDVLRVDTGGTIVSFDHTIEEIAHLFQNWHKHCFVWKSGEFIKWYADRYMPGQMELIEWKPTHSFTIPAGGALIMLQNQDSYFGTLGMNHVMSGYISGVNMFSTALESYEVKELRCRDKGDVVTWDTLLQQGIGWIFEESFPCTDGIEAGGCDLPAYLQTNTTQHYLYQTHLPPMEENTVCFHLFTDSDTDYDNRTNDFLVSIATDDDSNEYLLGWFEKETFKIQIRNVSHVLINDNKAENDALFVGWHKHCFTFRNGGDFKWYADKTTAGVMELIASVPTNDGGVRGNGTLVLLHDQDSIGGDLDSQEVTQGEISWFNIWSYEMNEGEIQRLTCADRGDAVTWDTLEQFGSLQMLTETFTDIPYRAAELKSMSNMKNIKDKSQAMVFCKIPGAFLNSHTFKTETDLNPRQCLSQCLRESDCLSVNYDTSTNQCYLNNNIDQGYEADFETDRDIAQFVHYTARECSDY